MTKKGSYSGVPRGRERSRSSIHGLNYAEKGRKGDERERTDVTEELDGRGIDSPVVVVAGKERVMIKEPRVEPAH
jgi:hypothetical protein